MKWKDHELLQVFDADPQQGMILLIEQYTGLIWHVVSHYLSNPEDLKECVNETFMDFFLHRARFQDQKGTLANFLAGIARNHAISRYRKERIRKTISFPASVTDSKEMFSYTEEKTDLERALKELRSDEFEIIRMKYYEGMSVQEIAEQIHLPYETVKKRHQRSISKLRKMLLFVLAVVLGALLFTACALNILRYFGLIPKYGINRNINTKVYELRESVSVENEYLKMELTEGVLLNGDLLLKGTITSKNEAIADILNAEKEYMKSISPEDIVWKVYYEGREISTSLYTRNMDAYTIYYEAFVQDITLEEREGIREGVLSGNGLKVPFKMIFIESETLEEYPLTIREQGGLLIRPETKEEELILSIYPLNTGKYEILPGLIRDSYAQNKTADVVVTSAEGNVVLPGICENYFPGSNSTYFEWNFGQAEPGMYQLHIPYLFLSALPEESAEIKLDLNTCSFDTEVYPIPEGTFSLISCEILEEDQTYQKWLIEVQTDMLSDQFEIAQIPINLSIPLIEGTEIIMPYKISHTGTTEDGIMQYQVMAPKSGYDLSACKLILGEAPVCLKWKQEIELEFKAE